jgi:3-phenylpropionate/cinnamic acid dioxygenase small subunit
MSHTADAFHDLTPGHAEIETGSPQPAGAVITGNDRGDLHDLVSRLGRWLDEKRYDDPRETASILAPEATVSTLGGEAAGLAEIAAQARRGHDAFVTHHQITNVIAERLGDDPDRAAIRANLQVVFSNGPTAESPVGEPLFTLGEVYGFEATRGDAGWRLTRVTIRPVWKIGERPRRSA